MNKVTNGAIHTHKRRTQTRIARVIAITSGKGGVGKTHITVNLGLCLHKLGRKVLLLDADLGLANINILLGFKPGVSINSVIDGQASIRDIIVTCHPGIDVVPAASGIPELVGLSPDKQRLLISAFEEIAHDYDYVLIDTAAGIGSNVVYFASAAEEVLVVIDPEPTAITDAYALIKVLATRWNTKEFAIIVNRTPEATDGREYYQHLSKVSEEFLPVKLDYTGSIADDSSLSEAVIRQTPLLELYPSARASRDLQRIACSVDAKRPAQRARGGLQFFFESLLYTR